MHAYSELAALLEKNPQSSNITATFLRNRLDLGGDSPSSKVCSKNMFQGKDKTTPDTI